MQRGLEVRAAARSGSRRGLNFDPGISTSEPPSCLMQPLLSGDLAHLVFHHAFKAHSPLRWDIGYSEFQTPFGAYLTNIPLFPHAPIHLTVTPLMYRIPSFAPTQELNHVD